MIGSFLAHTGRKEEAEASYIEALRLQPDNPLALNNLGYSLVERNDRLGEALELIQRAVDAAPDNPSFLDSLGWAYFKMGKLEEAERYLSMAVGSETKSPTVHEHLGDLYERLAKKELALKAWQKALSLSQEAEQTARLKSKIGAGSNK